MAVTSRVLTPEEALATINAQLSERGSFGAPITADELALYQLRDRVLEVVSQTSLKPSVRARLPAQGLCATVRAIDRRYLDARAQYEAAYAEAAAGDQQVRRQLEAVPQLADPWSFLNSIISLFVHAYRGCVGVDYHPATVRRRAWLIGVGYLEQARLQEMRTMIQARASALHRELEEQGDDVVDMTTLAALRQLEQVHVAEYSEPLLVEGLEIDTYVTGIEGRLQIASGTTGE